MNRFQAVIAPAVFFLLSSPLLEAQAPGPPPDSVSIRALDRVVTAQGETIECLILEENPVVGTDLKVKIRTVTTVLEAAKVKQIILRRSPAEAYANWVKWMRKESRSGGSLEAGDKRASAEMALAMWCRTPHVKLEDGGRPIPDMAHKHFVMAARADAGHVPVYPYLLASFIRANPLDQAPLAALNEEVDLYLRAQAGGYSSPDMDFRLAMIMSRRLGISNGAEKFFARVLASGEEASAANRSQRRKAREILSAIYMERAEPDKALGLYEALLQPELTADLNFEGLYNSAVILARTGGVEKTALALDRFSEARKLQPGFLDVDLRLAAIDYASGKPKEAAKRIKAYLAKVPKDLQAEIDLAILDITQGRFSKAEKIFQKALNETGEPSVLLRARLGLGSIEELRGNLSEAEAHYRSAISLSATNPLPALMLTTILIRQDRSEEAAALVTKVRSAHVGSQAVFGACSRLQALIDNRKGDTAKSSANLEFAVDVSPEDPAVLEAAGLAFLRQGKLEQGLGYLTRANKLQEGRPATLNGLGYCNYIQGHHSEAAVFFAQALEALEKGSSSKKAGESAFARDAKIYASHAQSLIRDLEILQVWVDEFENSAEGLINGWNEIELYGIDVAPVDSNVVFKGRQQKAPDGESGIRLLRVYRSRDIERIAVRVRIDSGRVVPSLRMTGPDGTRSALAVLSLYRDFDGRVRVRMRSSKGDDWIEPEEPVAAGDGEATRGPAYVGIVTWAEDTNFHTLEIRKARTSRGALKSNMFNLYFDGEPVAREIQVPGLTTSYQLAVMARTDALGNQSSVTVDNFKVYRAKAKKKK